MTPPVGDLIAGSRIGGIKETQKLLNFCGEHNIISDVEVIDIKDVNDAFKKLQKGQVRYRFVLDIGNTLRPT